LTCTEKGFAERETAMAAKVIPKDPDFVGSLAEVAPMTTCTSAGGGVAGAVYVTLVLVGLLRVPAPVAGEIVQEAGFTPLFAGSLVTIAVICDVPVACTEKGFAERETAMAGGTMDAVMLGGGGGALLPLLQPATNGTMTKPASQRARTNLLFTGPPERSGLETLATSRSSQDELHRTRQGSGNYLPVGCLRNLPTWNFHCRLTVPETIHLFLQPSASSGRTRNFRPSENA